MIRILCLNCAYLILRKPNDLVRVGPVGLEPTTYGIQVEAERRSALLVISALRLGRMGLLSRTESSLVVIVQRRLMGVKRGLPYH